MKTLIKILIALTTLGLVATAPIVRAQEGKKEQKREHAQQAADRLKQLTDDLSLTADQQAKVKAILEDETKAAQEIRKDKSLSKEDQKAKMQSVRKDGQEKIKAVLTPEQVEKFSSLHGHGGKKK